uniref:NADH dehydrogenase subunit 2 n=1 Tax=Raivuna sinica TaxID=2992948 RepID=UPI002551F2F3|nr:NADH dehydrogenase subunit 2 [Raivuna sinica]WGG26898.1 NADH dehydrogenase subunit 2 [Raivuna sinica]
MKMNSSKTLFMMMIMISTILSTASNNILMSWMSMEMNLIGFLPMMTKSKKMKDQSMKYLIIQSMASSMFLMSILMNLIIDCPVNESVMMMSSMLIKLGMMPFHLWMPMLMNSMSWMNCFLMMTWQKIIPTVIVSQMTNLKLMILPMLLSMMISPMVALNQLSIKKILAYSSISNIPIMITAMKLSKLIFIYLMVIYSMINFMLMSMMKKMNTMFMNQMMKQNKLNKLMIMMNFLSMSGLPPMMGFYPKWLIIQMTIKFSMLISIAMITSSIISTFIYLKMMLPMLLNSIKIIPNKIKTKTEVISMINMTGIFLPTILKMN